MSNPTQTTLDQVSKTTIQLLLKEPFYGHYFTGLLKEVSDQVPTLAVGSTSNNMVKLYVNAVFWEKVLHTPDFRYGVLKHEILHIVLKHILSVKSYSNKRIFNIAADIVVNQYIEKQQLPEGALLIENFSAMQLEKNKDVGYYYSKFLKEWQDILAQLDAAKTGEEKKLKQHQRAITNIMTQGHWTVDMHELWEKEFEKMTEAERRIIDQQLNDILKHTVRRIGPKGIGNLPAGLVEKIEEILASFEPVVDWKRVLRLFAASGARTYLKNTIRRPSKRYGTTPGIKVQKRQKILVAIDTSGSINMQDLTEFFGELYHVWRQHAEIKVVECDTDIHNSYFYTGKAPNTISGRGGTSFEAPIVYANTEYLPDLIIYFTDGYAAVPNTKNRKPILWLISSGGISEGHEIWKKLPGRKVKIA